MNNYYLIFARYSNLVEQCSLLRVDFNTKINYSKLKVCTNILFLLKVINRKSFLRNNYFLV